MVNATDYNAEAVNAGRSVLMELFHLLGEYREGIVLVGGWVPEFLFETPESTHVGSLDVDLALDFTVLQESGYRTIREHLLARGYIPGKQPFIFFRRVSTSSRDIMVQVDFLAGEYGGTTRRHRTQDVQDMQPRKARGCDLAFIMPLEITLHGSLPDGSLDITPIRISSIVPFLTMKAMALASRLKEKDAYDIYYCLSHHPGGIDGLADAFTPFLKNGLVQEGLGILAEKFASPDHIGPKSVADFEEVNDADDRTRVQRDVFERVNYLLDRLRK